MTDAMRSLGCRSFNPRFAHRNTAHPDLARAADLPGPDKDLPSFDVDAAIACLQSLPANVHEI